MFMGNIFLKDALLCFIGKEDKSLQSIIFVFITTCRVELTTNIIGNVHLSNIIVL